MKKSVKLLWTIFFILIYAAVSFFMMELVKNNGHYPTGVDTLCHIYKGDVLYQSIVEGNWWPAYDPLWYNGVEMLRYWAPLPVFILSGCEALAGGDPMLGYIYLLGFICFLGAVSWLVIGLKINRVKTAGFIGLIWFFMPNNLTQSFDEGNLPRAICMVWLPLLIYLINDYLQNQTWTDIPKLSILFAVTALCHSGYAGMIAIALLVYFIVYVIAYREYHRPLHIVFALILGYMLIGIWLVPSLIGGITSTDSSEIMVKYFQSIAVSLNPFYRLEAGGYTFYFGLAIALLSVFGLFMSKKKSQIGFATSIITLLCTTNTAYFLLCKLPGGQYLWMLRFISIALCMSLYSFLIWDSLKKFWIVLFSCLIILDGFSSYELIWGDQSGETCQNRIDEYLDWTLIGEAKEATSQRLALIDESKLDAMSAYLLTGKEAGKRVATSYGAAWQSSSTATNFKQLDRALEEGNYLYLFDRALEMGNDTVVVRTDLIEDIAAHPYSQMDEAAETLGYELLDYNDLYRFYKLTGVDGNFGTITNYDGVAIGTGAGAVARFFPYFKEVESTNLNDFTYEELSKYKEIYLDGFTYDDKESAEQLILKLSEAGVKIIITADGIHEDRRSHEQSFLDIICNKISFSMGYPLLDTIDGELDTDLFPAGYTDWSCMYVDGLKEVWGRLEEDDEDIAFFGTANNENIVVIGLNLTYYYSLTGDEGVGNLLGHAMDISSDELPDRQVVPISVISTSNSITIESDYDGVNTSIAYHDSFVSQQAISSDNHLTVVDSGTTYITMPYPYLYEGMTVSVLAAILIFIYALYIRSRARRKEANG